MGQIIGSAAKPKRCNLNQLSQVPTPAAGEYILVSSDNSMNAAGQGNFDCYIEGDGTKAATSLKLKPIETLASELDDQINGSLLQIVANIQTDSRYDFLRPNISFTNVEIPAGDYNVTCNLGGTFSQLMIYLFDSDENRVLISSIDPANNYHDMQYISSLYVEDYSPLRFNQDISKIALYADNKITDGTIEIVLTKSQRNRGLVDDVDDLQTDMASMQGEVEDINTTIGSSDYEVAETGSATPNTGFAKWFDVNIQIPAGTIVNVEETINNAPSRVILYENSTSGSSQHELLHQSGTTSFVTDHDITKFIVYGTGTTSGSVEITFSYIEAGSGILKRLDDMSGDTTSPLGGMKMAFLGSSITQGKPWVGFVAAAFGSEYVNCGVGGSAIVNEDDSALSNPKRLTGEYSNVVDPETGTVTPNGIALPTDSQIIFIEGGVNDWARNYPLGDKELTTTGGVIDVDDQTFYGACHQMMNNILARCPNAIIIAVGDIFGKLPNRAGFTDTYGIYNNHGLSSIDYGDALVEIAGMWGCRAFNFGKYVGINDSNVNTYGDGLHPTTDVYNHRIANAIVNFLREIKALEVYV